MYKIVEYVGSCPTTPGFWWIQDWKSRGELKKLLQRIHTEDTWGKQAKLSMETWTANPAKWMKPSGTGNPDTRWHGIILVAEPEVNEFGVVTP